MPDVKNWNEGQLAAIEARGGSVLVSAAAGSGKTAVLVERAIRRITDPETPVDADRLLVVTFTNAAAAQMKSRIRAALGSLLAKAPGDMRLQRQQLLLERAHIQTIHAFCADLVRQNFHALAIAPESRVADEHEAELLRSEAAADVIEEAYSAADPAFLELAETLGGGRSDAGLTEAVLSLHGFMRSHPYYEDWLDEKLALYNPALPPEDTAWGRVIMEYAAGALRRCEAMNREASSLAADDEAMRKAYGEALACDGAELAAISAAAETGDWDALRRRLQTVSVQRLSALRGREDDPLKARVLGLRKAYLDTVKKLGAEQFSADSVSFRGDIADLRPKIACLFTLVMEFDRRYAEAKAARSVLDYSDLEQLALRVLTEKGGDGRFIPTRTARELSERFDEIMVDEYQDVNKAQDTLFYAISREGANLFFVGDVKQSIYRFRQAMPELFLEKRAGWHRYDGKNWPANINLNKNYRSRKEIAGAVNFVFSRLMSTEVGEMEYLPEDMLDAAAESPEAAGPMNELVLVEHGGDDRLGAEAAAAARKIKEMVLSGTPVADGGALRPARWADFAVLLRSASGRVDIYARALRAEGIPCQSEHGGGFLALPEIAAALDALRAADDPLLDIPLAGAMLSEMFAFTPDEVAEMRLNEPDGRLWLAVTAAAENGDAKAAGFVRTMDELRRAAACSPADRVIEKLYELTSLPEILRAGGGELRLANLRLLVRYAANYEAGGWRGLSGFLRFIDRLQERGADLSPAGGAGRAENSVRLMSVHASKGLEFPIVFLCDTGHRFVFDDRSDKPMLHPELGFACPRRDPETGLRFTSAPQYAMKLKLRRAALSEELRILYVAMTRAKERLIVTAGAKDAGAYLSSLCGAAFSGAKVDPFDAAAAKCPADWLFAALLPHPDAAALRALCGSGAGKVLEDGTAWGFAVVRAAEEESAAGAEASPAAGTAARPEPDPETLALFQSAAAWRYPMQKATLIPAKFGVSELTHGEVRRELRFAARPTGGALSGAERGTALHTFMQFADFAAAEKSPLAEIARLTRLRYITEKQAAAIDPRKVSAFFAGPLYKRIKGSPWVRRELRFLRSVPAAEFGFDAAPDDLVAVQGVADCVFEEAGGLTVADYKTDYVEAPEELVARYGDQLRLYKRLLTEALGRSVTRAVIWSFRFGQEIEVE